jgi:hypothetical protein
MLLAWRELKVQYQVVKERWCQISCTLLDFDLLQMMEGCNWGHLLQILDSELEMTKLG